MKTPLPTVQSNERTCFDQKAMFAGILQMAREAGQEAIKETSLSGSVGLGDIVVPDRRRAFTKWLITSGNAEVCGWRSGALLEHEGGQWYWSARAYADAFCSVLKKCGIECYNTVELD